MNLIKLMCISEHTEDYFSSSITKKSKEKWEDYRGALIFWSIAAGITVFLIMPWVIGIFTLLRWIF